MSQGHISEDLQQFIAAHIDSIAHIEALLLLRETTPELWTAAALAERIYADEPTATSVLSRLQKDGMAVLEAGGYRYACASEHKEQMVQRLADAYRRFLIPVTNLIHSKPLRITQFADAFRLRRDN